MNKTNSPSWLGPDAKRYYQKHIKALPPLDVNQQELLAIAADHYETYRSANAEVQAYAKANGALTVTSAGGSLVPHPAIRISKNAIDTWLKVTSKLMQSLGKENVTFDNELSEYV